MGKFLRTGKVVLILAGRFAGRKAVIVQNSEKASKERPYSHALVAGVDKYPLKVRKSMGKKKVAFRSRIRPFLKIVNHNHMMPTQYNMDLQSEIRGKINITEKTKQESSKKVMKKTFQDRYKAGMSKWFFRKLRF
eukprot:Rhum_TRINITY_DN2652_c0_g1::Rhum_TRINITY_DN2652_c0_g1_i1::g.7699::m.7699/K02901/RP-L27e, RPL27; large subunit ribosomal protein L27e